MGIIDHFNKTAENYMEAQIKFHTKHPDKARNKLYKSLPPLKNKILLDVGCGFGKDLFYFQTEGAKVYGIDASEKMIELAKTNYPSLTNLSVQNFTKTNFKNNFFDIIVSRHALHYERYIPNAFKELHRILKPEGILMFIVQHPLISFLKKDADYEEYKTVRLSLYNDTYVTEQISHTLSDYFNTFVLKHFKVLLFIEGANFNNQNNKAHKIPDFLLLKLKKPLDTYERKLL